MLHVRKSNRLKGFDYSRVQLYFITSCVRDRVCVFGDVDIDTGRMVLNECGKITQRQWYWLEQQYPYVVLHEFVVMPNHVHGIIEINGDLLENDHSFNSTHSKIKSLSELMGAYKMTSSKHIHPFQSQDGSFPYQSFRWQRSFHDSHHTKSKGIRSDHPVYSKQSN